MSVVQHAPLRRPAPPARLAGALALGLVALVAALLTVASLLAAAWVAAGSALVVLLTTTTGFWALLEAHPRA